MHLTFHSILQYIRLTCRRWAWRIWRFLILKWKHSSFSKIAVWIHLVCHIILSCQTHILPQRTWSWQWRSWSCSSSNHCWRSSSPHRPCSSPDEQNQPRWTEENFLYQADCNLKNILIVCHMSLEFFVIMDSIAAIVILIGAINTVFFTTSLIFLKIPHLPTGNLGLGDNLLLLFLLPLLGELKLCYFNYGWLHNINMQKLLCSFNRSSSTIW